MMHALPNILTIVRIVLTVGAIALVPFAPAHLYVYLFVLFFVAALTDFADGYLARRFDVVSDFGKVFDPLSDKVLAFVFFFILYGTGIVPQVVILLLVVRDLVVDGVRAALASHVVVPAIYTAKVKTALIFVFILSALYELAFVTASVAHVVTLVLAAGALLFSYVSAAQYAAVFYRAYQKSTSGANNSSSA